MPLAGRRSATADGQDFFESGGHADRSDRANRPGALSELDTNSREVASAMGWSNPVYRIGANTLGSQFNIEVLAYSGGEGRRQ